MFGPPEVKTGFSQRVLTTELANGQARASLAGGEITPTTFELRIAGMTLRHRESFWEQENPQRNPTWKMGRTGRLP